MHIKIVGFKCHVDSHFDIKTNSMILLKGPSGCGKTSIFESIYWCLYGNMRGVYNNTSNIKKCSVTLKTNELLIYRQKNPELLKVSILSKTLSDNQTYEDKVGQEIINQVFGSKKLWKSCSYISQKQRCTLLSGTANEKLTLLNQLSFDRDDPKEYINKINTVLKESNKNFLVLQTEYTTEVNLFSEKLENKPTSINLSEIEIESLKNKINTDEINLKKLYQAVLKHEQKQGSYNLIINQIKNNESDINSTLKQIENYDEKQFVLNIKSLEDEIQNLRSYYQTINDDYLKYQNYIKTKNLLQNYQKQMSDININITDTYKKIEQYINSIPKNQQEKLQQLYKNKSSNITKEYIWQVINQEKQLNQNKQECNKLQCNYNEESLQTYIKNIQNELTNIQSLQRNLPNYNNLKKLKNIKTVKTVQILESLESIEQKIHSQAVHISELKKGRTLLECPECHKYLRYTDNKLIKGDTKYVTNDQLKNEEHNYITLVNNQKIKKENIVLDNKIKMLSDHLTNLDINSLETFSKNPQNSFNLQNKLTNVSRIKIIPEIEYTSYFLELLFNINKYRLDKQNIKLQIDTLDKDLKLYNITEEYKYNPNQLQTINNEIQSKTITLNNSRIEHNNIISKISVINQIKNNLSKLIVQKKTIELSLQPLIKEKYNNNVLELKQNKNKYSESLYTSEMIKTQTNLSNKRNKVIKSNTELVALQRLKHNAISVECKQLEDTVETINRILNDILPLFFDDPITMMFRLQKQNKTNKGIKIGPNISIKYKGVEYNNINNLSGGEGDRISLALILALNQVSNSSMILLDECISSLDGNLKESCVNAMKKLNDKTIICIDHEGVEGFFDNVILVH